MYTCVPLRPLIDLSHEATHALQLLAATCVPFLPLVDLSHEATHKLQLLKDTVEGGCV